MRNIVQVNNSRNNSKINLFLKVDHQDLLIQVEGEA